MKPIWILSSVSVLLSQTTATNDHAPAVQTSKESADVAVIYIKDKPSECDPTFFEVTEKNLDDSGSDIFYRNFILETSKKHPGDYIRLGEVSFFARYAYNGLDVRCSSFKGGCAGIPTCKEVLDHVLHNNGDRDLARKIYFSMKKVEFIVDEIYGFHRIFAIIEQNAGLVGDMIVKNFVPQRKERADDECKVTQQAINAISTIARTIVTMSSPPAGGSVGALFFLALNLAQEFGEDGKEHVDAAILEEVVKKSTAGPQEGDIIPEHVTTLCPKGGNLLYGGSEPDEKFSHSAALKREIVRRTSSVRGTMSKILDMVVAGNAIAHPEFNHLYELMSGQSWTEAARRRFESFDERQVTLIFHKSLITFSWKHSKCYEKCLCSKEDGSALRLCSIRDPKALFRYCPDDGKGCACQLHCYTSILDGPNQEVELLGRDQLELWGVDFDDVLIKSYDKYRKTDTERLPTDKGFIGSVELKESIFELPTCASSQISLRDEGTKGQKPNNPDESKKPGKRINQHFPCTCGNWRSDETRIFLEALGLGRFQPDYKSGAVKELFTKDCPGNLLRARLKPLNHFLAYCELGIKWPHHDDVKFSHGKVPLGERHRTHMHMIDPRCSIIKDETAGMSEDEANLHFCTMSPAGELVFADELSHIDGIGLPLPGWGFKGPDSGNHHHMCKRWLHY